MSVADVALLLVPIVVVALWVLAICLVRAARQGDRQEGGYDTSFGRHLSDRDHS